MEWRGGCCTARYVGGSSMDRVMLRFRPIAPKPTAGGSVSPPVNGAGKFTKAGREKRRYTRGTTKSVNSNNNNDSIKRKRKADQDKGSDGSRSSGSAGESETIVTLPLLPDTPVTGNVKKAAVVRTVESWVTVESVREGWVEREGLGSTDEERRMNLDRDTCPGFVSDGTGRVRWTSKAYRKMVGQGEGERDEEVNMVVSVLARDKVGLMTYSPAFTCTVSVRYTCGNDTISSVTAPCDVWRMDGGGFAWRLDVKSALTLSLLR